MIENIFVVSSLREEIHKAPESYCKNSQTISFTLLSEEEMD